MSSLHCHILRPLRVRAVCSCCRLRAAVPAMGRRSLPVLHWPFVVFVVSLAYSVAAGDGGNADYHTARHTDAYVTSISATGLPEDYSVYIASRVMLQSLKRTMPNADILALVSRALPQQWISELERDGVMVRRVEDIPSPWERKGGVGSHNRLRPWNKLWAWTLEEYERVVLLGHDNIFLLNTDELFQCGEFCAVFINPCYFHTGLLVIHPSKRTFDELRRRMPALAAETDTEQQLFNAFLPDFLGGDLFRPNENGTRQTGHFRLPLGYQMDASFFYYKLRWMIDCSSKSVITFPVVLGLVPWYWYSWPLLPLGFMWHEIRRTTIGYHPEKLWVLMQAVGYISIAMCALIARWRVFTEPLLGLLGPHHLANLEGGKIWSSNSIHAAGLKVLTLGAIGFAFVFPFSLVPLAVHPLMGWGLFLLGSLSLLVVLISALHLPVGATLSPWFFTIVAFLLMASPGLLSLPGFTPGLFRFLSIGLLAFLGSPFLFHALKQVVRSVGASDSATIARDPPLFRPWQIEPTAGLSKIC